MVSLLFVCFLFGNVTLRDICTLDVLPPLPLLCRGRYSLALYAQMGHLDLVARDAGHYVSLVTKLLEDTAFRSEQSSQVEYKFHHNIHKNNLVAAEWARFFTKLTNKK
jgi:hypothetical protein